MKKIILNSCIAVLLGMYACQQQKVVYYDINSNTKILFKKNDTLIFNSSMNTDSFVISNIDDWKKEYDKTHFYEHLDIYYKKIDTSKVEDSIYITDSYNIYRTQKGTNLDWRNLGGAIDYTSKNDTNLIIGSLTIKKVFILNENSSKKHSLYDVKKVFYCDLYGVIRYEKYNGQIFTLDNKYLSKYIK